MGTYADFSLFYTYSAKPSDSLAGQEVEVTTAPSPSLPFSIAMTLMMGNSFCPAPQGRRGGRWSGGAAAPPYFFRTQFGTLRVSNIWNALQKCSYKPEVLSISWSWHCMKFVNRPRPSWKLMCYWDVLILIMGLVEKYGHHSSISGRPNPHSRPTKRDIFNPGIGCRRSTIWMMMNF